MWKVFKELVPLGKGEVILKKSHDDKNEEGDEAASGELNSSDVNEFVGVQVAILP